MKIHLVFHISLLEPAPDSVPIQTKVPDDYLMHQENHYVVKKLLDNKSVRGVRHFLVKWKDHGDEYNSWIEEQDLQDPEGALRDLADEARSKRKRRKK